MSEEFEGMTHEEVLAVLNGEDSAETAATSEFNKRIYEESRKYINMPVENWPKIVMNWDTTITSQRFTLDGESQEAFESNYPNGFLLGYVSLIEMDSILHNFSRRDSGELWQVGCTSKLARLIVYLSENRPISPPLIKPVENDQVILQGGHHRYAIAKVTDVKILPIHVVPEYKNTIDNLLNVEWKNA